MFDSFYLKHFKHEIFGFELEEEMVVDDEDQIVDHVAGHGKHDDGLTTVPVRPRTYRRSDVQGKGSNLELAMFCLAMCLNSVQPAKRATRQDGIAWIAEFQIFRLETYF